MTDNELEASDFFVVGGTLRPGSPSYVRRPADDEFFRALQAGDFCYVLTARQMGKSSLMIQTRSLLQDHGIRTAIVDLTRIGTGVSAEQWYFGVLTEIINKLSLTCNLEGWWQESEALPTVQRFLRYLRDEIVANVPQPIVIFMDEIDVTLGLDFRDDFFAAIRAMYNARAYEPLYNRLTFALLGVATPDDLIANKNRTPFNIGRRIDLAEFSRHDAQVLESGLKAVYSEQGKAVLDRIFHWTSGHPYLTQKLCLEMATTPVAGGWRLNARVDEQVREIFLSGKASKEENLQYVRDNVQQSRYRQEMLAIYEKVYRGKRVPDEPLSVAQNQLQLFGLVRVDKRRLQVRNEVYRQAFNQQWISANK